MEKEELDGRVARARNFLCGYQLCVDMLNLRKHERRRATRFEEIFDGEDILTGNEALWRARMHEVAALIDGMRNSREKLMLYYRYVRGESIEHAADMLGISRRTGYRLHQKGLFMVSFLLDRLKKRNADALE